MKTSTLSALLVALLASPQSSLGRAIPAGGHSDKSNGPDVAYWQKVNPNRCGTPSCRSLALTGNLNTPAKRAPPPIPKPVVVAPVPKPGGAGAGAGASGAGKAGVGVGAAGAGAGGAAHPGGAPGAAPPAAAPAGLDQYGAPIAAPAANPGKRPAPGSPGSPGAQPDPKVPKVVPGSPDPAAPVAGPSNPRPAAGAAGTVDEPRVVPQFVIDRNRNAPGGVFNLDDKNYETTVVQDSGDITPLFEVRNKAKFRVALIEVDKPEFTVGAKDLRFSKETDRNGKVTSIGDQTPERARAFEAIMDTWTNKAKMRPDQMKALDYDKVEEQDTNPVLMTYFEPPNKPTGDKTFRPADGAEFNRIMQTPLGRIGEDIVQHTPIGKRIDRIVIQRPRPEEEPQMKIHFV